MVEIREGQVYIDNKKLDTFYSKALYRGMDEETYFEKVDPVNRVNDESWREYFTTNMKPVMVTENTVFVLVDNWWRGIDSKDYGVLPIEKVKGKVLGYKK